MRRRPIDGTRAAGLIVPMIVVLLTALASEGAAQERPNFPSSNRACTNENAALAETAWKEAQDGSNGQMFAIGSRGEIMVAEWIWAELTPEQQHNTAKVAGVYSNCVFGYVDVDGNRRWDIDSWAVTLFSREAWENCERWFILASGWERDGEFRTHYPGDGYLMEDPDPPPEQCRKRSSN